MFEVNGNGFLKFGKVNLPFKIDSEKSYLQEIDDEGKLLLVGLIVGEIKNKNNQTEDITINMVYYPNTNKGQYTVVVGYITEEIIIPFGDTILNKRLVELLDREVYQQNIIKGDN